MRPKYLQKYRLQPMENKMKTSGEAYPEGRLPARAAVSVAVGMMVGAGLFRSPAVVAANVGSDAALFLAWIFGGALGVVGALCYAELASTYPSRGGDYFFLKQRKQTVGD